MIDAEASLLAAHVALEDPVAEDVAQGLKDLEVLPESFVSPQCAQQVRPAPCSVPCCALQMCMHADDLLHFRYVHPNLL